MGYTVDSIKEELMAKGYSDGIICLGGEENGLTKTAGFWGGAIGGAIAGATRKFVVITSKDKDIVVIPYTSKEIKYSEGFKIGAESIKSSKLSGFITKTLTLVTNSGKTLKYEIFKQTSNAKLLLEKLGLSA